MRSTLRPSHATQAERDRTIPENLSPRAAATRAMWPCAVPIRPAYDTRARSEFVSSSNQRRTPKPEFRSPRRTSRRCRFANRTDNSADDDHFDQAANACVNEQFSWKRLHGVNAHTHANRCDFQQNAQADSCDYTAASETGHVDHHERNNDEGLADQDPMEKAQHFSLGPPEIWRLRIDIFEQNAVKQPTADEQENICGDKSDD